MSTHRSSVGPSRALEASRPHRRRRPWLWLALVVSALVAWGCNRASEGSPEAVADAFADAYFHRADQEKAKEYTAFGATKMLDAEIEQVRQVRGEGFGPGEASLHVEVERGERSTRGERVRFDYVLRYKSEAGDVVKHADVELARVHEHWKVVRIGLAEPAPPASS